MSRITRPKAHSLQPVHSSECKVGVVVPRTARPGDVIRLTATDGEKYVFTVPHGAEPGKAIEVTVPRAVADTLPAECSAHVRATDAQLPRHRPEAPRSR